MTVHLNWNMDCSNPSGNLYTLHMDFIHYTYTWRLACTHRDKMASGNSLILFEIKIIKLTSVRIYDFSVVHIISFVQHCIENQKLNKLVVRLVCCFYFVITNKEDLNFKFKPTMWNHGNKKIVILHKIKKYTIGIRVCWWGKLNLTL